MTIVPAIPGACRDTIRQGCDRSGPSSGRIIPAAENDPNFQEPKGEFFEFFSIVACTREPALYRAELLA